VDDGHPIATHHSQELQMNTQNLTRFSGAALALLAAGLASYAVPGQSKVKDAVAAGNVDLVHCSGVNVCKGHNDSSTASNECKGQGSCKGQGFVAAPAAACDSIGGTVIDKGQSMSVASSGFVHCMGVNVCKGHNDCKTATNACKGHGECKGQGFVALPAAACSNIGGTAG
jgi:hypothetical protein